MSDYASLCFLSYNRAQFLSEAVASAKSAAGYPCEVVVHDDGSTDPSVMPMLTGMLERGEISRLVANPPGRNEGVGAAFNRAVGVATGDPVIKLDQDLVFNSGWLADVVRILDDDRSVAALGLFRYHCDPVDWRKMNHREPPADLRSGHEYVDDFVGSAIAIPRRAWRELGRFPEHSAAFAEDVEWKKNAQAAGWELALPTSDLAVNRGFGVGPSTVAVIRDGELTASEIVTETTVFR